MLKNPQICREFFAIQSGIRSADIAEALQLSPPDWKTSPYHVKRSHLARRSSNPRCTHVFRREMTYCFGCSIPVGCLIRSSNSPRSTPFIGTTVKLIVSLSIAIPVSFTGTETNPCDISGKKITGSPGS